MKKIIISTIAVILIISSLCCINVFAYNSTETTVIDTYVENTENIENAEDTLTALNNINRNIITIQFILIFAIFIHYSEKWLRIALEHINKSGRVN